MEKDLCQRVSNLLAKGQFILFHILILFILSLILFQPALAAPIKLAWDPNTEPDLAGYKVYYGAASRVYGSSINVGNVTTYTVTGLIPGKTYFFAVTAYNTSNLESNYSNEVAGTANDLETVSTPNMLSGPTSGTIEISYTYTVIGSTSNLGHAVQYQFDWKGDGTDLSPWGSATQAKTWTAAGTYNVRARARCATDTAVVSNWSGSLSVTISAPTGMVSSCSHSECFYGEALTNGCSSCVTTVCAQDLYCCNNEWDSFCVYEAKWGCGICE